MRLVQQCRSRYVRLLVTVMVIALYSHSSTLLAAEESRPAAAVDSAGIDENAALTWSYRQFTLDGTGKWQKQHYRPRMSVMFEVTQYAGLEATPDQEKRAADLVTRSLEVAKKRGWFEFEKGIQDGYSLMPTDPLHYVNMEYVLDDRVADPERPEILMYYGTTKGFRLAGIMFLMNELNKNGPQIGGPLTVWHYHMSDRPYCFVNKLVIVSFTDPDGHCAEGEPQYVGPEMMHVWFVDHQSGPFGTEMALSREAWEKLEQQDF